MLRRVALTIAMIVTIFSYAQNGQISGKVIDQNTSEEIIGAIVAVKGTSLGTATDIEGQYLIDKVPPGTYTLIISYVSYNKKEVSGVVVKAGEVTTLNISIEESAAALDEIVVQAEYKKESVSSVLLERKKAVFIGDGVSAEVIKQSPDNNTGEALKRVSGATIQGGKFAVIRGLNERYNLAMINNSPLPSTEPEKRAFALDLFPSNMLDQLNIVKSATPDVPGDWAGGIIKIVTKDVPEAKFLSVGLSGGFNHITTFKDFKSYEGSKTDWLGYDNGYRSLPDGLPSTKELNALPIAELSELGKKFNNNYKINSNSASPNIGFNVSTGTKYKTENGYIGIIFSGLYSQSKGFQTVERNWYDISKVPIYEYRDSLYESNARIGGLLNITWKIGEKHKLSLKNTYNHTGEDQVATRDGYNYNDGQQYRSYTYQFTFNRFFYSQLSGEHVLNKKKWKATWEGAFGNTLRKIPDYKNLEYRNGAVALSGVNPNSGMGRLFTNLDEDIKSVNYNLEIPYKLKEVRGNVKVGGFHQLKERVFDARLFGFARARSNFNNSLLTLAPETIFSAQNFYATLPSGWKVGELTSPSDHYDAQSSVNAAYLSLDIQFLTRFKLVGGARYENFRQKLNSYNIQENAPVNIDTTWNDLLPSANLIYTLSEKANLRASYFKSLSRPEFRELAPFAFFDFNTFSILQGNSNLQRTQINNFDLRYEIYPNSGEAISFSLFYKQFKNPIELILPSFASPGAINRYYANLPLANNYGAELDFRKTLAFISERLKNFTVYGNFSYIFSEIDLKGNLNSYNNKRPMQGQSPYIANLGLQWNNKEKGWSVSALYNQYGNRIYNVGTLAIPDIYEKARPLVDVQVTKKLLKNKLEIKASVSDLIAKDLIFFFDYDKDKKYDETKDRITYRYKMPRIIGLSVSYKL